jgi:histidyl-tRNA synthetase
MIKTMKLIKPQTLKGFNDWFAEDVKIREYVIGIFKQVFEKYGYEPLETPALEYSEFMLGQSGGEAEKQYYRFKDPGGRDVMLKYEVMIGMCRAVGSNIDKITLPYKRYQIQPVWRAENTQKGRYRQFTQCDADTIGSSSIIADAEFIQMGLEITQKLGFKNFVARISNRKFLDGLREYLGIPPDKFYGMCMSIDKFKKIGPDAVKKELIEKREISSKQAAQIIKIIDTDKYKSLSNYQIIDSLSPTVGETKVGQEGLNELKEIFNYLKLVGSPEKQCRFDTAIARGLASYTGPVWEFEVIDGNVGSIAGCGRYDNAIGKYLGNGKKIPATGGSFGIERICEILKDKKMINLGKTNTKILVTIFSPELQEESVRLSKKLRDSGINSDLYAIPEDKLDKQIKYADKKGIPYVIILGPDEIKNGKLTVKNLSNGEQKTISAQNLEKIKELFL